MDEGLTARPLCAFTQTFGRGILLTATVPGDLEDSLHFGRPYALRLPEAVRRGIVVVNNEL